MKGSDLGFSLSKIEKVLELKRQLGKVRQKSQQIQPEKRFQDFQISKPYYKSHDEVTAVAEIEKKIALLLTDLTRVEYSTDEINNEFKRKRKKKYRRKL